MNILGALTAPQVDGGGIIGLILLLILLLVVFVIFVTFVRRYKRCPSNKILVIYGKTGRGAARCVHGGAAFIWPLIQSYDYLDLEPFPVDIDLTNALSQENIRVAVPTRVTAAISTQGGIMENAAIRLLGLTLPQIQVQAQDIILGQMRAVIATMRIEDINRDRQLFMQRVNEAVSIELEKVGLMLINVNIRDIEDESGYIKAIGRKAAAEAIQQANIDVAEQEKRGATGVAERQRDQRVSVANAGALAQIGEANADRDRRQNIAGLDAQAVEKETQANAAKAGFRANQKVAEEVSRQKGESAAKEADAAIRVAQEMAQKRAEEAKAQREQARLNAELVVPANAQREQVVIAADAEKQQAIKHAEGQAAAKLAVMTAEGTGIQAILDGKAAGYRGLFDACGADAQAAATMLMLEKLVEVAHVQAQAIQDLPIEKIIVWDGGDSGGLANLGRKIMGTLPPMHEVAKQVGLELPEFLGRMAKEMEKDASKDTGKKEPPATSGGTAEKK